MCRMPCDAGISRDHALKIATPIRDDFPGLAPPSLNDVILEGSKIIRTQLNLPPLFRPNFGGVPVAPDRPCWGQSVTI